MNSLSPAFYNMEPNEDHIGDRHQFFGQIHHQLDSSSSFYSYQFYFNNSAQDQVGYCPTDQVHLPHHQLEGDNKCATHDEVENKVEDNDLEVSLGSTENRYDDQVQKKNIIPDKWISSKMRVMQKMKKSDRKRGGDHRKLAADQKLDHPSSSLHMDVAEYSSNSSSSPNYSNTPVRVCSDCNTTKTPLWRSGPKGPKSLCNACGIRQRKARRALAAAAAAAAEDGTTFGATTTTTTATPTRVKIKLTTHKDKTTTTTKNNGNYAAQTTVPFKKRRKATANAVGNSQQQKHSKNPGFEDFLVNLTNNLAAIHNVFPQDEKEAAILLMALSCGLVHG